ncbi:MAG: TfoX/Sxy family protein [Oscillospiraceae bacterium]|nr:TfoX/Sxy family protein [Oscillospiraceae bacterium]
MASSMSYVEFIMEQMSGAGAITCCRMFGEYGLYCDGTYFGAVCNDRALVKITPAGEALLPDCPRGIPYEGGGEMFLPDAEDRETLAELVRVTCAALPGKKKAAQGRTVPPQRGNHNGQN